MTCDFIAVLDDSTQVLESLTAQIHRLYPDLQIPVHIFNNPSKLRFFLEDKESVCGIIFMDILLGTESGIEQTIEIQKQSTMWKVIFITGYTEYLSDIFLAKPDGLLYKPIADDRLCMVLDTMLQKIDEQDTLFITVKSVGSDKFKIPADEIIYLESHLRIITIHLRNKSIDTYAKLSDMRSLLPASFKQCHKSYLVNEREIRKISGNHLIMSDNTEIPISRAKKKEIKTCFFDRMNHINNVWDK